jgi:site-specific DNA-methyltransferase (adenine-specific)
MEYLKSLPDNSIDLIVTSPPYNLNIQYAEHNDAMTLEVYYDWCKEWITECLRILKPSGTLYIYGYMETLSYIQAERT